MEKRRYNIQKAAIIMLMAGVILIVLAILTIGATVVSTVCMYTASGFILTSLLTLVVTTK